MPSLAALLGLLAVAGYQNRDKLGELLHGAAKPNPDGTTAPSAGPLGGVLKSITGMFGGADPMKTVQGGIADVVDKFRNAGHGAAADSWIAKGENQPVTPVQTESALGGDLIDTLVKQTGLTREELLARLAKLLPDAVDKMTPDGKMPAPQA